ncbi:MAG: hypothetical protein ACO2PM_01425 [Pyrobaculum sp.]
MKYLIRLLYKKCWDDIEVRSYIRRYLLDDLDASEAEKLLKIFDILDELAAKCLGEVDDLPPPP